jgi:hypothetical protein
MNVSGSVSIEAVRAKVVSLIIQCPIDGNPASCQIHDKRSLSFSEKFEWLKSLPDTELQKIYSIHCECLKANGYQA